MHGRSVEEVSPGAFHLRGYLGAEEQKVLAGRCRDVAGGAAGLYTPVVRTGGRMRLQMLCLGLHWNARTYKYERVRSDYDGRDVPKLPEDFKQLAVRAAGEVGMRIRPDVCIVNYYQEEGRLGLHQDKDEQRDVLDTGIPVVSISLGDTAKFLFGGTRRRDKTRCILLQSGDAFVFGGPSRLRYHGVSRILPGTAPSELRMEGRFNLTFRQYSLRQL